ncbi:MAG: hypothetical protein OQK45_05125 [Sulfurovum sp.]|nr:hypothetical protein [Sulfurovum sp.]
MKVKTLANITAFIFITSASTHANTQGSIAEVKYVSHNNASITTIYQKMSTVQLQEEIEKHSNNGKLSVAMCQELMRRWTKS